MAQNITTRIQAAFAKKLPIRFKKSAGTTVNITNENGGIYTVDATKTMLKKFTGKTAYMESDHVIGISNSINERKTTLEVKDWLVIASCQNDLVENIYPKWVMQPQYATLLLYKQPVYLLLAVNKNIKHEITINFCQPIRYAGSEPVKTVNITARQIRNIWEKSNGKKIIYIYSYSSVLNTDVKSPLSKDEIIIQRNNGNAILDDNAFNIINYAVKDWLTTHSQIIINPDYTMKLKIKAKHHRSFWHKVAKIALPQTTHLSTQMMRTTSETITSTIFDRIPQLASYDEPLMNWINKNDYWENLLAQSRIEETCKKLSKTLIWQLPIVNKYIRSIRCKENYYNYYWWESVSFFDGYDTNKVPIAKTPWQKDNASPCFNLEVAHQTFPLSNTDNTFADIDPEPEKNLPEIFNIIDECNPREKIFITNNAAISLTGQSKISHITIRPNIKTK